jgi:integrase
VPNSQKFSDIGLRNLPLPAAGQADYWDQSFPGGCFGCRVSQGGTKTFVVKKNNRRISIGRFPILSLADARAEAKRILAEQTLGKTRPAAVSYEHARRLFLEDVQARTKRKTHYEYERLLKRLTFSGSLAQFTSAEFERRLKKFSSPSERDHLRVAAKVFFNWCIKRKYLAENPAAGAEPVKSTSRSRVLTDDELKCIWQACEQLGRGNLDVAVREPGNQKSSSAPPSLPANFATIVKLLILTGQRRSEIASLQRTWIKKNEITLPPEITKNGREHTFPLGSMSIAIASPMLTSAKPMKSAFLFPAKGNPTQPFNGWSKAKAALDAVSGVTDWTLHDLRRTFATIHARIGTPIHVTERLLNHISGTQAGIVSVYQKHTYLPEMRKAMEAYEQDFLRIVSPVRLYEAA